MKSPTTRLNEFVVHCLMCGKNFRAGDKAECGGFFAGKPICKTKHIQAEIDARLAARKEPPMPDIFSLTNQHSIIARAVDTQDDARPLALTERGLAVQKGNNKRFSPLRAARAAAVLEYLAEHQPASRSEIARHVGCAPDTLTHILRGMAEAKQIRSIGICKGARWALHGWTDHKARMAE